MALGKTVAQLLAETSSRELAEWRAYATIEPFGEDRADLRAGVIAATIYNMQRGSAQPALRPIDFMPYADPKDRKRAQSASLSEQIKTAFSKFQG